MALPEHFKLMIADRPGGKIFELLPLIFIFAMYIIGSIVKNKAKPAPPVRQVKKPPDTTVTSAGPGASPYQQQQRQESRPQPSRVTAVSQQQRLAGVIPLIKAVGQPRTRPAQPSAAAKSSGHNNIRWQAGSIPVVAPVKKSLRPQSISPQPESTRQVSSGRSLIPRGRNAMSQAVIYAEILGKPLALRSDQNGQYLL